MELSINEFAGEISLAQDTPILLRKAIKNAIDAFNTATGKAVGYPSFWATVVVRFNNSGNANIRMIKNWVPDDLGDPDTTDLTSGNVSTYGFKLANGDNFPFDHLDCNNTVLMAVAAPAVLQVRAYFG